MENTTLCRAAEEFEMRRAVLICVMLAVLSPRCVEAAERIWRVGVLSLAEDNLVGSVILPYLATRGLLEELKGATMEAIGALDTTAKSPVLEFPATFPGTFRRHHRLARASGDLTACIEKRLR